MADKTWDDLLDLIHGEMPRDAGVHDDVYVRRVNIAIDIINDRSGGFESRWVNDGETGSIVLSDNTCTFPSDLQKAQIVHWNDTLLVYKSERQLEMLDPKWRTRTGTPSYYTLTARGLVLDCNPGSDEGSDLEIWGLGCIPHLEFETDSINPFAYLPLPHQTAPAFYVMGNVPLYGRAREEVVAVQADYRRQWKEFLESVEWGVITRKYPQMDS
jgi:hypothetical protein